jgi:hypothetical protein
MHGIARASTLSAVTRKKSVTGTQILILDGLPFSPSEHVVDGFIDNPTPSVKTMPSFGESGFKTVERVGLGSHTSSEMEYRGMLFGSP